MKVVVFSDAHGNKQALERVLEFNPDASYVISLGDSEFRHAYLLDLNIIAIKGNYPFDGGIGYDEILEIEGKKLFLTHGHRYRVRRDIRELVEKANKIQADLVLFGHTHIPFSDRLNGVYYLNPGSIGSPRTSIGATYLVLNIEKDKGISFAFRQAQTNLLINHI